MIPLTFDLCPLGPPGYLSVLMNCQWQSLLCRVEAGLLNMFGQEDLEGDTSRGRSPQYTVQLRGCDISGGPDTQRSCRITLSMLGDPVAVLEVSTAPRCSTGPRPHRRSLIGPWSRCRAARRSSAG